MIRWLALGLVGYLPTLWAWNAEGHRVVAEIAWHHMSPEARARFNPAHPALDEENRPASFQEASVWFDKVCKLADRSLKEMHYIDIPFTQTSALNSIFKPHTVNGLMAFNHAKHVLLTGEGSSLHEAIALRIVLHVSADLHQPMHTVTHITDKYPKGDAGGNKQRLPHNQVAKNLHAYWDRGGGFLLGKSSVESKARALEKIWPCDVAVQDTEPTHWVAESYVYAIEHAYTVSKRSLKSGQYQAAVYKHSEQRLAEAGCRLAAVLNEVASYGVPVVV